MVLSYRLHKFLDPDDALRKMINFPGITTPSDFENCKETYQVKNNGDLRNYTLIMIAVKFEFVHSLKIILEIPRLRSLINYQDKAGFTALMLATRRTNHRYQLVKLLLGEIPSELMELQDTECDINIQDRFGFTALMHASDRCKTNGDFECVKLLLSRGADTKCQTVWSYGYTALDIARTTRSSDECVEYF